MDGPRNVFIEEFGDKKKPQPPKEKQKPSPEPVQSDNIFISEFGVKKKDGTQPSLGSAGAKLQTTSKDVSSVGIGLLPLDEKPSIEIEAPGQLYDVSVSETTTTKPSATNKIIPKEFKPESAQDFNNRFDEETGRKEFSLSEPGAATNILETDRADKKRKDFEEKKFIKNQEIKKGIDAALNNINSLDGSINDFFELKKNAPKLFDQVRLQNNIEIGPEDIQGDNQEDKLVSRVYNSYQDKAAEQKLELFRQRREGLSEQIDEALPVISGFTGKKYAAPKNLQEAQQILTDINEKKAVDRALIEADNGGIVDRTAKLALANKAAQEAEKSLPAITQAVSGFVFEEESRNNPNATPFEIGKKIYSIVNPEGYAIYQEAGGDKMYRQGSFGSGYSDTPKKADAINRQMMELGINAFQTFGNKEAIEKAGQENSYLKWKFTRPVEEETKHMIAASLLAQGIKPHKATDQEKDAVAETLPQVNRDMWFDRNKVDNNTSLPSTGLGYSTKDSYRNTVEDASKTLLGWMMPDRGRERALDVLEQQGSSEIVGENPESKARLSALEKKEKAGTITDAEKGEKELLEKYTDVRTGWQKFKDLSGSGVGQFAGFGTISAFTGGLSNARGVGGAVKSLVSPMADREGMLVGGYLMSREGNARDAATMFPGEKDGIKRFVAGEVFSFIDTYIARLFPEEKFLSGPIKKQVAELIPKLTAENLRKELGEGLAGKITKTVVKGIAEQQKVPLQESVEEVVAAKLKDVFSGIVDPSREDITFDELLNVGTQSYLSTQLLGVPKGVMSQRNPTVPVNAIWDAASNQATYDDVKMTILEMKQKGDLTEQQANERISLLNTAQKNWRDNPVLSGNLGNLPLPKKQNYLARLMNEQVLQNKADETNDEVVKSQYNKEISASKKARAAMYDGDVAVNERNEEIPQTDDAWKERIAAATTEEEKNQIMRQHGDWLIKEGKKDKTFLKDQSLSTPNNLIERLGGEDGVIEVIATNKVEDIKAALKTWTANLEAAELGSLEFEDAENHLALLEKGLEKAQLPNENTADEAGKISVEEQINRLRVSADMNTQTANMMPPEQMEDKQRLWDSAKKDREEADRLEAEQNAKSNEAATPPKGNEALSDIEKRRKKELAANGVNRLLPLNIDDNPGLQKEIDLQDKINAKYDAEIAALPKSESATKSISVSGKPEPLDKETIAASEKWMSDLFSLPDGTKIKDKDGNLYTVKFNKLFDKDGLIFNNGKRTGAIPDFFKSGYETITSEEEVVTETEPNQDSGAAEEKTGAKKVVRKVLNDMARARGIEVNDEMTDEEIIDLIDQTPPPNKESAAGTIDGDGIGITHAQTEDIRERYNFGDFQRGEPNTVKQWDEEAAARLKKEGMEPLLEKMRTGDHIPSPVEQRMMLQIVGYWDNIVSKNPSDANFRRFKEVVELSDRAGGRAAGQSLVARKGEKVADESLAAFMLQTAEEAGVDVLTKGQKIASEIQFRELQDARAKFEEWKSQKENELNEREANLKLEEIKKKTVGKKKAAKDLTAERKQIIDDILLKFAQKNDNTSFLGVAKLGEIAPDVLKLARNLVESGVKTLEELVTQIHGALKPSIPDIEESEIQEIIAGKHTEKKATRTELMIQWQDLKQEAKYLEELEALNRGEEPTTDKAQKKRNQRLKELSEKIKNHPLTKQSDERKADQRKLEDLTDRLNDLEAGKEPKKDVKEKREVSDGIKELQKKIKNHDLQLVADAKQRMKNQTKKIREQLDKKDFSTEEKKEVVLDAEGKALQTKLAKVQRERQVYLLKERYDKRSKQRKFLDKVGKAFNVPRSIMASMDFSALLNQGLIPTLSHPKMALSAMKQMKDSMLSEGEFNRWFQEIQDSPRWDLIKDKMKIRLTDPFSPFLEAREEAFGGGYAEQIPFLGTHLIKGSERAYVQYLNKLRWDMANRLIKKWEDDGKTFDNSEKLYKLTGKFVNDITGSGELPMKLEQYNGIFNSLFFSPRLLVSRLRLLSGYYLVAPPELRKEFLKEMGTSLGLVSAVVMAFYLRSMGGDDDDPNKIKVELDPRSTDFFKIRQGDTRYNPLGGFQPLVRLSAQMIKGEAKSANSGVIQKLDGEGPFGRDRGSELWRFVRGKASPIAASFINAINGENIVGEKTTLKNEILRSVIPLTAQSIAEAWSEYGWSSLLRIGLPSAIGIGVQTYKPREKEIKKTVTYTEKDSNGKSVPAKAKLTKEQHEEYETESRKRIEKYIDELKATEGYDDMPVEMQVELKSYFEGVAVREVEKEIVTKYKSTFEKEDAEKDKKRKDKEDIIKKVKDNLKD